MGLIRFPVALRQDSVQKVSVGVIAKLWVQVAQTHDPIQREVTEAGRMPTFVVVLLFTHKTSRLQEQ